MDEKKKQVVSDLRALEKQGAAVLASLQRPSGDFIRLYAAWYAQAAQLVHDFLPESTFDVFKNAHIDGVYSPKSYCESSSDMGVTGKKVMKKRLNFMLGVFSTIRPRLEKTIFQLYSEIRTKVFTSELDACKSLLEQAKDRRKAGENTELPVRATGAIAGVVLERHLVSVASGRGITIKPRATLGSLVKTLADGQVIDSMYEDRLKACTKIRNKCDHALKDKPTVEDVQHLINETEFFVGSLA